ncbi:MAG TPA: hypothetical protein PKA06_14880, partial [Gemmatales bacterium]|nr:hypothetical protein [Gemmatales bacterium]
WLYSLGLLWPVVLLSLRQLWKYASTRWLMMLWMTVLLADVLLVTWVLPHYLGPALPAWGLLVTLALWFCTSDRSPILQNIALALLLAASVQFLYERGMEGFAARLPWMEQRQQILQELEQQQGLHLVFLQYAPDHDVGEEWVYNSADIPTQRVIWVRSISPAKDKALGEKYPERSAWLLQVPGDRSKPVLKPYLQ